MIPLLLLCLCCLATGSALERRVLFNTLTQRVLVVFTIAAGQLLVSIQGLSLAGRLTGVYLLALNAALTAVAVVSGRSARAAPGRRSWGQLLQGARAELVAEPVSPWVWGMLATAAVSICGRCVLGAALIPLGDLYHFEMPLYWIQNRSIAPFAVSNPRIVAVSFLGEALAMPGYLYARSGLVFVPLTLFASLLVLGIIFHLARHLGCGRNASLAAAAVVAGFPEFAMTLLTERAGTYLSIMWAAGSLLFLLESRPTRLSQQALPGGKSDAQGGGADCHQCASPGPPGGPTTWDAHDNWIGLGCSLVCFVMGCGSKNSLAMAGPFYLLAVLLTYQGALLRRPALKTTLLAGVLGLACSGVAWNYLANKTWFGSVGGSQFLQSFVARDFQPRAIWTRVLRGTALVVADTLYVPRPARAVYVSTIQSTVRLLGGSHRLKEDDDFFSFDEKAVTPLKGLGLVGLGFVIPGAAVGLWRCSRRRDTSPGQARCQAVVVLLLVALGYFVMCHAFFRWQSLGLARLAPAFGLIAAPLAGLVLERRFFRMIALALLLASTGFFFVHDLSFLGRRVQPAENHAVFKWISRFAGDHSSWVTFAVDGQAPQKLRIRESYTQREVLEKLRELIPSPAVIGFAGHENFEGYHLFGRRFENRVIPLSDARRPSLLLEPGPEIQYVVLGGCSDAERAWASQRNFRWLADATDSRGGVIGVFRRVSPN